MEQKDNQEDNKEDNKERFLKALDVFGIANAKKFIPEIFL
jgi:hypothetical protein